MLKKLRAKFIVINMTIVTVMLCFIFVVFFHSTKQNLERESLQMMKSIAGNPFHFIPPGEPREAAELPYFSIMINREEEIMEQGGVLWDRSDREQLENILKEARETEKESGILEDCHLRFYRTETPMGQCLVFADIRGEQTILQNLFQMLLFTGSMAFLIFLGISMLLAGWAVRPVEKAWEQQKQFVADASHELKTPLTVIMTDAELLRHPVCSREERGELADSILTISRQMSGLVESLLELARIDSGSIRNIRQRVAFSEIVRETALMFEPVFFEKEMPFSYEIEEDLVLTGNEAHLKQLAEIFLDNASKYASGQGKTILTLQRLPAKRCLLSVSNQGAPIPEEDQKNLFKRFYRADKARTSRSSYGLGLSIADRIVKEHHGKIRVESRGGYNSFHVELPV